MKKIIFYFEGVYNGLDAKSVRGGTCGPFGVKNTNENDFCIGHGRMACAILCGLVGH